MKKTRNNAKENFNSTKAKRSSKDKIKPDRQTLSLDVDYYQQFLEESELPDEKKRELIETLWNIVVTFVDLGFGIDPVQSVIAKEDKITTRPRARAAIKQGEPVEEGLGA